MTKLFQKFLNKKYRLGNKSQIFIWTLFDFANTSFSIVVVTFLFAVYFKDTIVSGRPEGDLYWSFATSLSMIITAFISPVLGAIADYSAGKKRFLLFFTLLCVCCTSLLFTLTKGDIFLGVFIFVLANVGFEAGLVFYDSFLPELTAPKNYGRVSGYGFGMGYLGSLVVLALCFPLISKDLIRETFILASVFFFIFSLPLFLFLRDNRKIITEKINFVEIGITRVLSTIKNLPNYKNLAIFLLAYFFYIEGVNTVIFFSGNYASSTLKMTMQELIVFFIIVQTTAIIGSVIFGILSDKTGQKKGIIVSLIIWIITMLFAYITSDSGSLITAYFTHLFGISVYDYQKLTFYIVGLLAGGVMGATQSTSRSLMSQLTPIDKKTEFFGFYSFFGKSSAILGPLTFGLVSYFSGSQRLAILSICIFFVIGIIILSFVKDYRIVRKAS